MNKLYPVLLPAMLLLFAGPASYAQQHKAVKAKKKTQHFTPPVVPDEKPAETNRPGAEISNTVQGNGGGDAASSLSAYADFDYEAYKVKLKRTDSLQQELGIFRKADSMVAVVLARYHDTCKHPGPLHAQLIVENYKRYHEEIVLQPYKGIWRVWYYFDEGLYFETTKQHHVPRVFPYHFLIEINQPANKAIMKKEVFSQAYQPQ